MLTVPVPSFHVLQIQGQTAYIPSFLPQTGWSLHSKGYLIYTSRKRGTLKRGESAHRAVLKYLLSTDLPQDFHVHHQDFNKLNCLPENLVLVPCYFNPATCLRDPYTGQYLSKTEYERRYGISREELPSWVTAA